MPSAFPSRVQGLREVVLDCVAVAPVVERAKLGPEMFASGLVFKIVVVDGLRAAQVIDADDEQAEVLKGADRTEINEGQTDSDKRDQNQRNLEVCSSPLDRRTVRVEPATSWNVLSGPSHHPVQDRSGRYADDPSRATEDMVRKDGVFGRT